MKCWYCGNNVKKKHLTRDHVHPRMLGGVGADGFTGNLVDACVKCNHAKSCMTLSQYRYKVFGNDRGKFAGEKEFIGRPAINLGRNFQSPADLVWVTIIALAQEHIWASV